MFAPEFTVIEEEYFNKFSNDSFNTEIQYFPCVFFRLIIEFKHQCIFSHSSCKFEKHVRDESRTRWTESMTLTTSLMLVFVSSHLFSMITKLSSIFTKLRLEIRNRRFLLFQIETINLKIPFW